MSQIYSLDGVQSLPAARRLIVLVPDGEFDCIGLGRQIWDLAQVNRSRVLFLKAARNADEEMHAVNTLSKLFAVTHDAIIQVETRLQRHLSWVQAIRAELKPGDLLICFDHQQVRKRLLWRLPLSDCLAAELDVPVYVLNLPTGSYE